MSPARISVALSERLGEAASAALMEVLDVQQRASTEAAMTRCGERFERRVSEETSKVRVELTQMGGDMREGFAVLRGEMRAGFAAVREDIAGNRFELLKWSFAFWLGQLVAIAGIVGLLLRTIPTR